MEHLSTPIEQMRETAQRMRELSDSVHGAIAARDQRMRDISEALPSTLRGPLAAHFDTLTATLLRLIDAHLTAGNNLSTSASVAEAAEQANTTGFSASAT